MAKNPIKWRVGEKPTGPYSSFQRRRFPSAEHSETGRPLFQISCEDDYVSKNHKNHAPLRLLVAVTREDKSGWDWKYLKGEFKTLQELKDRAAHVFKTQPHWFIN